MSAFLFDGVETIKIQQFNEKDRNLLLAAVACGLKQAVVISVDRRYVVLAVGLENCVHTRKNDEKYVNLSEILGLA